MTGKKIGVGIIGGGLMGREIAAALRRWPALIDHPAEPELVAVCDINPAALEFFERIDTVQLTTTDHHELLVDPRVDVVYIAVRHDLHERLYVDTVRAGKALLADLDLADLKLGPRGVPLAGCLAAEDVADDRDREARVGRHPVLDDVAQVDARAAV